MVNTVTAAAAVLLAGAAMYASPGHVVAAQTAALKIVVLEGEDAVNLIDKKTAVKPTVEVRDRNDLPIAGALVRFSIRGRAAAFNNGVRELSLTTDSLGRAAVSELSPLGRGAIEIQVNASYQGQTAVATIHQTNFATAAQAAQAGRMPPQGAQPASTGSTGATTTATTGTTGGAGGGLSGLAIAGIIGGAAAGTAAGVAVSRRNDSPCEFTVSPQAVSVPASGGTASIALTSSPGGNCQWTAATASTVGAITSAASGIGSATVTVTVAANNGDARTGTLTVANQTIAVTQAAGGITGTFQGSAASVTVPFAGPPFCGYTVTLSGISSTVQFTANRVTAANVTVIVTEAAVPPCPFAAIPQNTHSYTLRSSTLNGVNLTIDFNAAAANAPQATLQFVGTVGGALEAPAALIGTLMWQRIDEPTAPSLQWRAAAPVTMSPR